MCLIACGGRCAEKPTTGARAFASRSVRSLEDARASDAGIVVVNEREDQSEEVVSLALTGEVRWVSRPARTGLLGETVAEAPWLIRGDGGSWTLDALVPATGRVERSVRLAANASDWLRRGNVLVAAEAPSQGTGTLALLDPESGAARWARSADRLIEPWWFAGEHAPPIFRGGDLLLACRAPEREREPFSDLCRYRLSDGALVEAIGGPINDAASGEALYLARDRTIDARSDGGKTRWRWAAPADYQPKRVAVASGVVFTLVERVESRDRYDEQIFALAASDGHELWSLASGSGGGHFDSDNFASASDRLFFTANLSPELRLYDLSGKQVLGGHLETQLVVTTELAGGFTEELRGRPFFAGPFLLLAREKPGLEVYRAR